MSVTYEETLPSVRANKIKSAFKNKFALGLAALIAFSATISLADIASSARSEYYAAIAKSMSLSFSNWFSVHSTLPVRSR